MRESGFTGVLIAITATEQDRLELEGEYHGMSEDAARDVVPLTKDAGNDPTEHSPASATAEDVPLLSDTGTGSGPGYESSTAEEGGRISLLSVLNYTPGESARVYLPGLGVVARVTASSNRMRAEVYKISLEHGPFEWEVYKTYLDFFALRRVLYPYRARVGRNQQQMLPRLFSPGVMNPSGRRRVPLKVEKVQCFIAAVLSDAELLKHDSTLKFLEISRLSFVEDLGNKRKEGVVGQSTGGRRRLTNCFGCHSCVCECPEWAQRWLVLKDSYLAFLESDTRSVADVLLFDHPMTIEIGIRRTGARFGLKITNPTRELLIKCPSHKSTLRWKDALETAMSTTGKEWVEKRPLDSFAPVRKNATVKWFVDGEGYMNTVAMALLAAKEEIYITDWMLSPHMYLKRDEPEASLLEWRLDQILLKKASEGVKVFIQVYKEVTLAVNLASAFAQTTLQHKNIVFFRHPEHLSAGVFLWSHHEKLVVIDQTLAFIGGIDLAFGRWDTHCHRLGDHGRPPAHLSTTADASKPVQKWIGKDYYNTYVKDFAELETPFEDLIDRDVHQRMPWHDIASCVYGEAARDTARHFIQRYNFTKHEQEQENDPALLPRKAFSDEESGATKYLLDLIPDPPTTNASVQVLRSTAGWTLGTVHTEHSILNAYVQAIENSEHFIYIEQQFFISSIPSEDVENKIVDALRLRIVRAHKENQQFRVVAVVPLLPGLGGEIGETSGQVLEAVMHWTYSTINRGKESLINRLVNNDGIPSSEVRKYFSVYALRATGTHAGVPATEILYVHSKCMVVDDRVTIIGSANINDRSMLGDRDSEVCILVKDEEMIDGTMNGMPYKVGKFSHSLRCHLFREHLGLLEEQDLPVARRDIDVTDPACDAFYLGVWLASAERNQEIFEEVFGGRAIPTDKALSYEQYRTFKENGGVVGRDVERARELLQELQGSLALLSLRFLEQEDLTLDILRTAASLTPDKVLQ